MALIDGETLGERVRSRGPLSDAEATRLLREVGWALAYAHLQGIVHRDVKPDNILLERGTGRALIMDFGIAQVGAVSGGDSEGGSEAVSEVVSESVSVVVSGAEGTNAVLGTAELMSPEQAKGAHVDARSDLYSLGAVGFYAVSGRFPFEGASASVVMAKHVTEPAPPVASVAPQVSAPLARVIDRCLRKEPDARFADGGAIADALAHDAAVDRPIPVALRVFIKRLRALIQSAFATSMLVSLFAVPQLLILSEGGALALVVVLTAGLSLVGGGHLGSLAYEARKVLKAGHTLEDTRLALQLDVTRWNEELRFEVGDRRVVSAVSVGALVAGVGAVGAVVIFGAPEFLLGVGGLGILLGSVMTLRKVVRGVKAAELVGKGLLKILGGRFGDRVFKLAGLGLRDAVPVGIGAYRPTEMAIGLAANKLFDDLPKETRRELAGLPDTVQKLEEDVRALRVQVRELNSVLAEIGDDPAAPGSEAREKIRAEVEATRDAAAARLRDAVTALEQVRLGLIRIHAGEQVLPNVTMELKAAKDLSEDMANLLEGHREVERLLAERRATGMFTIVEE
jgi:serine/threonine-protein kinase